MPTLNSAVGTTADSPSAVELDDVSVSLPQATLLRSISWRVRRGARGAILGPNGSGKSTLLRVITGYGHLTSGHASVLGQTIGQTNINELRQRLGIVDPRLARWVEPKITALELVAAGFYASLTPYYDQPTDAERQRGLESLREVGLSDRADQQFLTLSSGQQTRVWLARAMVHGPDLLVLDEPTADLDLLARETFLGTLSQIAAVRPELTMLMVTHHLEDLLPNTSDVLLLRQGSVVAAGPPESVLKAETLSATFDCPVQVTQRAGRWSWHVSPHVWKSLVDGAISAE
ncbi:MAG: ATP-binding cassette domain-containing protein [Pirellulales bacterium]